MRVPASARVQGWGVGGLTGDRQPRVFVMIPYSSSPPTRVEDVCSKCIFLIFSYANSFGHLLGLVVVEDLTVNIFKTFFEHAP